MSSKPANERADIYTRITHKIIEELANGVRPWIQPWKAAHANGRITRPLRHNGQPYSGSTCCFFGRKGSREAIPRRSG